MTNATNFYNINSGGWNSNNNASNANGVCFGFCRRDMIRVNTGRQSTPNAGEIRPNCRRRASPSRKGKYAGRIRPAGRFLHGSGSIT